TTGGDDGGGPVGGVDESPADGGGPVGGIDARPAAANNAARDGIGRTIFPRAGGQLEVERFTGLVGRTSTELSGARDESVTTLPITGAKDASPALPMATMVFMAIATILALLGAWVTRSKERLN
ncbi:MAG: hypothetical protein M3121_02450, partial [Chloroflexota bacterium]|nr:hypothetical protein [Chloroflexota bacterium]